MMKQTNVDIFLAMLICCMFCSSLCVGCAFARLSSPSSSSFPLDCLVYILERVDSIINIVIIFLLSLSLLVSSFPVLCVIDREREEQTLQLRMK